jgi:hypothetical protein
VVLESSEGRVRKLPITLSGLEGSIGARKGIGMLLEVEGCQVGQKIDLDGWAN